MTLSAIDVWTARYRAGAPGPIRRSPPLSPAERRELSRLRRLGEVPPFRHVDPELAANGERDPDTGCLVWMRARNAKGYGFRTVRINGRRTTVYAHRLALEAKLGRPIAPGMQAGHTCANPSCFEPDHLAEVTMPANIAERWDRWRHSPPPP